MNGVIIIFKSEVDFGLDNFQQPKVLSEEDSIAQVLMNLLLMKPGQLPSMPHIGIDIKSYLYSFEEDIDVSALKNKIYSQCSTVVPFLDFDNLELLVTNYKGTDVLLLIIPFSINKQQKDMLIGFYQSDIGDLLMQYQIENR